MTRMLTDRRIVVGVDGTEAAAAAVDWAVREARLRHATVHLVCAAYHDPRLRAPYAPSSPVPEQAEHEVARAELGAAVELARRGLPPARLMAEIADDLPARVLLSRAAGAEMLVLGTNRPAGQPPGAMGAVARACVSRAPCPVVIVTPGDHPARERTGTKGLPGRGSAGPSALVSGQRAAPR